MKIRELHVRIGILIAVFVSMLVGFHAMLLHHAPDMFRAPNEDMSYGWYVPIFSLYVVWVERRKIRESLGAPSWCGLLCALPFLALGFLGVRGVQLRFEVVAFAGLLLASVWALFGRSAAKAVAFPCLFLLFCIPLATFLDIVTVHLRILASSTAFVVLRGCGADIVRQGTLVAAADGSFAIDVADPCSGLRSLFALMALTAAYAYFNQPTWLRRGILFAASVPLAILGNVMRILSIVMVATFASPSLATGFYHDYSGFVVFAVAIVLMLATSEAITRVADRLAAEKGARPDASVSPATPPALPRRSPVAAIYPLLVIPLLCFQAMTPDVLLAEAPEVRLGEIAGFESQALEPSEAELEVLPKDTRFEKRRYLSSTGDWLQVSVVIGGRSKSSIHRPELCLPAQGFRMDRPRTRAVAGRDWRMIELSSKDSPPHGFAYTFFNQDGYATASHVSRILRDVIDRSVFNRIDRWVMVTVTASATDDAAFAAALAKIPLEIGGSR